MKKPKPKPLSKREQAWIGRLQRTLDACPTKRLGFYTIGDPNVTIYDRRFDNHIEENNNDMDFCNAVDSNDAHLSDVEFPSCVHSTSG